MVRKIDYGITLFRKEMMNDEFLRSLESQLERERDEVVQCAGTRDFEEGIQSFFEKRDPEFSKS